MLSGGRGCGAGRCARRRGLQGERGSGGGGGREAVAPAAAGGPIAGEEGAAEAESGRGSQRLCLPPSSLGRRNQSRGRGWEGSGARAGAGAGGGERGVAVATVRRRDSREGAVRPGAAGAELSGGRVRGPGAGPECAGGCGTRLPRPFASPLSDWEPPVASWSRGQRGAGK